MSSSPNPVPKPATLAEAAKLAAQAGGAELMRLRGKFETRSKGDRDFVTDADVASQEAIRKSLLSDFPEHAFVGEEACTSEEEGPEGKSSIPAGQICWVVDPLDGTTNYLHDFPSFAVAIAAICDDVPLAGVVFDPMRDEMFWASQGGGAWLGNQRLETSRVKRLAEGLLAISLPASVGPNSPELTDFSRVAPACQAVRRIGSAALNLAYVACGRLDAYWARNINAWDVAAGVLLVTEAGGLVSDAKDKPLDLWSPPCAASCGESVHEELLNLLASSA